MFEEKKINLKPYIVWREYEHELQIVFSRYASGNFSLTYVNN